MVSRIDNKSPQCDSAAGYDHDPSPGPPVPGRVVPGRGIDGPAARLVITAEGCAEQPAWKSALEAVSLPWGGEGGQAVAPAPIAETVVSPALSLRSMGGCQGVLSLTDNCRNPGGLLRQISPN